MNQEINRQALLWGLLCKQWSCKSKRKNKGGMKSTGWGEGMTESGVPMVVETGRNNIKNSLRLSNYILIHSWCISFFLNSLLFSIGRFVKYVHVLWHSSKDLIITDLDEQTIL